MDPKSTASIFVLLVIYINHVSGVKVPQPDKLEVNNVEGEIVVHWKHPSDTPANYHYNVEMAKYTEEWATLAGCTGITNPYCDISSVIHDYRAGYKVRVQLVIGDRASAWTHKKILPNQSDLQPPSFTLWATSSTLKVCVHHKPILKKLFPFGITYTIYLEGTDGEKNATAYLKDDMEVEERTTVFRSLHWGKYCVSILAEANGAPSKSRLSPKQCLKLPEQEWFIIAVSSLSVLGVLAIIVIIAAVLLCYVKRPGKTPAALKSPVSGWHPLSVEEGKMEVVRDKGWFLSSYRTEEKNCVTLPVTHIAVPVNNEEEDRGTSTDSGVSMASNSLNGGHPWTRQEDSGCGSMGGPESSTSSQADYPLEDEGTDAHTVREREDSGLGMSCKLDSSSLNLDDGQDSEYFKGHGGHYPSRDPSPVQARVCGEGGVLKQTLPESTMAEVVTGYRAGPQLCICSGAGQCTWCHKQGHNGAEANKHYRAVRIENTLLATPCGLTDTYKGAVTFSEYARKTHINSVRINDLEATFLPLGETFPLLTSVSTLPLMTCGQDLNMNTSLSLCDVQLQAD